MLSMLGASHSPGPREGPLALPSTSTYWGDDAGDRSAVGNQAPQGTKLAQRFDFVGGAAPGTAAALLRRRHRHQPRRLLRGRAQRPDWFIRVIDYPYQCNFELGAVQRSFGLQRQLLYRL